MQQLQWLRKAKKPSDWLVLVSETVIITYDKVLRWSYKTQRIYSNFRRSGVFYSTNTIPSLLNQLSQKFYCWPNISPKPDPHPNTLNGWKSLDPALPCRGLFHNNDCLAVRYPLLIKWGWSRQWARLEGYTPSWFVWAFQSHRSCREEFRPPQTAGWCFLSSWHGITCREAKDTVSHITYNLWQD